MLKEQFFQILQEFADLLGIELQPDEETGTVVFTVDSDILVNLRYLDAADSILIFSPAGGLGSLSAADAGAKALALLHLTDIGSPCGHVTLALDETAGLVLAMDRRSALTIVTVDILAAWIEYLIEAVRNVRSYFADNFPVQEQE